MINKLFLHIPDLYLFTFPFCSLASEQTTIEVQPVDPNISKCEESIVTNLLSDDVSKMIWLSKTKNQIVEAKLVLKNYVESTEPYNDAAILRKKSALLKAFMQVCRLFKWLEPAKDVWNDKFFMDRVGFIDMQGKTLSLNIPTAALCYLDLLYEKKQYQDVINEVQKIETAVTVPPYLYAVGMMACLKLNTISSLDAAKAFYNGPSGGHIMHISRVVHPYVLLLSKHDKMSQALETMSLMSSRNFRPLRAGIMVYLLANLDRPFEACALLENSLRNSQREDKALAMARGQTIPKHIFSLESVKALTKSVESRNDLKLNARLAGIFSKLDKIASITDQSMMQLVTAEIDANSSIKSKRRWQARKIEENTYEETEDTIDDVCHR